MKFFTILLAGWVCCFTVADVRSAEPIYQNDPQIVELLQGVKAGHAMVLPPVKVECGEQKRFGIPEYGPGQRDYCNKMPYAADRGTAIYAGGNHQVPHRMNDVWEYHLGSNTWHMLYAPDGGDPSPHKGAYLLTSRTLVANPAKELTKQEREEIAAYKQWWEEYVVFRDGHLTTKAGGPIMPAHTWDAFTYDPNVGRMLWGMGVSPAGQLSTLSYFTGKPLAELQDQADPTYTEMWMFDVRQTKWQQYRTDGPHAALEGMGATMHYIPELKQSIWYVAAQNVSPAAYEMWLFDAVHDRWTELTPNGGKSIDTLATKDQVAPMSEQQVAYSAKHRKLVAVLEQDTFVYDIDKNEWSKTAHDERLDATTLAQCSPTTTRPMFFCWYRPKEKQSWPRSRSPPESGKRLPIKATTFPKRATAAAWGITIPRSTFSSFNCEIRSACGSIVTKSANFPAQVASWPNSKTRN